MVRTDKTERIVIRCTEEEKRSWEAFNAGFETQDEALSALLEAYANDTKRCRSISFTF